MLFCYVNLKQQISSCRDLVRVVTLTDMTRTVTAPLVHIRKLESKAGVRPGTVLQQNGDNVDMSRSFSDPRADLATRRQSARPEVDYSGGREGQEAGQALPIPQMLDILDKVEPPPPPDERSVHSPGG